MSTKEGHAIRPGIDALGASLMVLVTLSWGFNQVAIKVANAGLQPVFQVGLRAALGGALVVLWCRFRGIALLERDGTLLAGIALGALFGADFVMIYLSLDYTTVSRSVVFLYTMPLFVAAAAHFLLPGERLTPRRATGLVAAFVGIVIAFADRPSAPSSDAWIGDFLALGAGMGWASSTILMRRTRLITISAEKVTVYQLIVSAVLVLAISPLFGPYVREIDGLVVAAFAYQVVVVVAITYVVWYWMLRKYPATQLSAFAFLTPVFAVIFGGVMLSEPVTVNLVVALVLVASGIYLVSQPRRT